MKNVELTRDALSRVKPDVLRQKCRIYRDNDRDINPWSKEILKKGTNRWRILDRVCKIVNHNNTDYRKHGNVVVSMKNLKTLPADIKISACDIVNFSLRNNCEFVDPFSLVNINEFGQKAKTIMKWCQTKQRNTSSVSPKIPFRSRSPSLFSTSLASSGCSRSIIPPTPRSQSPSNLKKYKRLVPKKLKSPSVRSRASSVYSEFSIPSYQVPRNNIPFY